MGNGPPRTLLIVMCVLCILACGICPCRGDSERIRVLVMGYLERGPPVISSFRQDPLVVCSKVPTNFDLGLMAGTKGWDQRLVETIGGRIVRMYFPRSRTALVEGYDLLVYEDAWLDPYRPEQIADMRYAIEKKGLGAFVTCGDQLVTYTTGGWYAWHNSVLRELMPVELTEAAASSVAQRYAGFRIKIIKDDPPVLGMFKQFGVEKIDGNGNAWFEPRQGSTVWADMVHPFKSPTGSNAWLVSWKTGAQGGHFWMLADCLWFIWWDPYLNEYAPDVFMNVLLYSTGRDLPKDIVLVHTIRRQYWLYAQYASYLQSLFAFVENFGANTLNLVEQLDQIDQVREESFDHFRNQKHEEALSSIRAAMNQFSDLEKKSFKLKDATLIWVYLIEWATVTSVFMISGACLWFLMVRRRLFREVSATRLKQDESMGDC